MLRQLARLLLFASIFISPILAHAQSGQKTALFILYGIEEDRASRVIEKDGGNLEFVKSGNDKVILKGTVQQIDICKYFLELENFGGERTLGIGRSNVLADFSSAGPSKIEVYINGNFRLLGSKICFLKEGAQPDAHKCREYEVSQERASQRERVILALRHLSELGCKGSAF